MTSFGWGQRTCLGQSVTRDETFVACGALLWGFDMSQKRSPDGTLIEASTTKSNSLLIVKPDPFQMAFEPRSDARRADILWEWEASNKADLEARRLFQEIATAARCSLKC